MADKEKKAKIKAEKKLDKKKLKAPKAGSGKHWFKDFRAELKRVIWPTKRQLAENTTVVISMVIIVAVIIFLLDLAFKSITGAITSGIVGAKNSSADTNEIVNSVEVDTNSETVEATESEEAVEVTETTEKDAE